MVFAIILLLRCWGLVREFMRAAGISHVQVFFRPVFQLVRLGQRLVHSSLQCLRVTQCAKCIVGDD